MLKNLLRQTVPQDLIMRLRPPLPTAPDELAPTAAERPDAMAEYARLSKSLGLAMPQIDGDLRIERFKTFLRAKDWLVFSLPTVIAYMDKKAVEESDMKAGWHWRPLRERDHLRDAQFGRAATAWGIGGIQFDERGRVVDDGVRRVAASDHYRGPHKDTNARIFRFGEDTSPREVPASAEPYDKLVPLHALKKTAAITEQFREPVSFFVCDYAPGPHVEYPDPFLMAVINNSQLAKGVGRFVIDFWDEPGFGLAEQLA